MSKTFLVSDTHFGHLGVCKFMRADGITKLRPWDSVEAMDLELIARWNSVVGVNDKVYHLGDVVINRKALEVLHRLNGTKVLIKGNHDIFKLTDYTAYFKDIRAYHVLDNMLLSHIPVHPSSKGRFKANIHGHTHANRIMLASDPTSVDPFYQCVSVEQIDYTPIEFGALQNKLLKEISPDKPAAPIPRS